MKKTRGLSLTRQRLLYLRERRRRAGYRKRLALLACTVLALFYIAVLSKNWRSVLNISEEQRTELRREAEPGSSDGRRWEGFGMTFRLEKGELTIYRERGEER